jgi:hypothetical protein
VDRGGSLFWGRLRRVDRLVERDEHRACVFWCECACRAEGLLVQDNARGEKASEMSAQNDLPVDARTALAGKLTETGHLLEARVYYANTDFSGAVYHARYLEFLERGRIEYLRLIGVHHAQLADGKHGDQFVWIIRRMKLEFRRPAPATF